MPNINDRIGSQNVIRVLSNASAPPTRLVNLSDVDSTRKTIDGMMLIWDASSEIFKMTDVFDSESFLVSGISTFSNITQSSSPSTGALVLSGGAGITKNLNVGGGLQVTGMSTFTGITTTVSDFYVGADLYVSNDLILDGIVANQINISGVATAQSLSIGSTTVLSDGFQLQNISSLDAVTAATIESAIETGPNTFESLNITGVSTFVGLSNFNSGFISAGIVTFTTIVDVTGHTELDSLNVSGIGTIVQLVAGTAKVSELTATRVVYVGANGELQDNSNFTFDGTELSVGLIDGGSY